MPTRVYNTKADYDADYKLAITQKLIPLGVRSLTFLGNTITVSPSMWPEVLEGGRLRLSLGKQLRNGKMTTHINNRSEVIVTSVSGNLITVDGPPFENNVFITGPSSVQYYTPQFKLNFDAPVLREPYRNVMANIVQALGWNGTERVVVVGCGFGWGLGWLLDNGFNAVGIETSQYIHDNKETDPVSEISSKLAAQGISPSSPAGQAVLSDIGASIKVDENVKPRLLNESGSTNQSRNNIRKTLGNLDPTHALTENVMSVLSDQDALVLNNVCGQIAPNVAHYINCLVGDEAYGWREGDNWKTVQDWKTFLSPSIVVANRNYEVL